MNKKKLLIFAFSYVFIFLLGAVMVYSWNRNEMYKTKKTLQAETQRYNASVRIYDTVVGCFSNGNCDFLETEKKVVGIIGNDKILYRDFILKTTPHENR